MGIRVVNRSSEFITPTGVVIPDVNVKKVNLKTCNIKPIAEIATSRVSSIPRFLFTKLMLAY